MSEVGISTPTLKWNGETLPVAANSIEYSRGDGEITVRSFSNGGRSVTTVHTRNADTMKSMLKFSLPNTARMMDVVARMKSELATNDLELTDNEVQIAFVGMSLTNEPPMKLSHDGTIDLEFSGDPVTAGGNI